MSKQRRYLMAIGAAVGGLAAAAVVPIAFAHADDCDLGVCSLVSGGSPTDVEYSGVQPLFAEWTDTQPVNVLDPDSSFADGITGSYSVSEADYDSPFSDTSVYKFGTFTPAADNTGGIDSDGLSGATINDFALDPSVNAADEPGNVPPAGTTVTAPFDDLNVTYANGDEEQVISAFGDTNYLDVTPTGSADWLQVGDNTPTLLFSSIPDVTVPAQLADLASVLPPDLWFPGI
jgi:hypothetical protein